MKKIIILLIAMILSFSCNKISKKINITGKWSTYSKANGYIEFDIDTSKMILFSHYGGNLGKFKYKLVNDTLKIINYKFPTEIIKISDSLIVLNNKSQKDTLKRLKETTITFHEINNKNDSIFSDFYDKFEKRAFSQMVENGLMTEVEYNDHFKKKTQN